MSGAVVVLAGVLGLVIGSFLTVVAHRVPAGLSIVRPGSACPVCGTPITALGNIPLFSYVLQRGRCRACSARIPLRYPLLEAATAAGFAVTAARYGAALELAALCVFIAALLVLSVIDLEHLRLPTPIIAVAAALGALLLSARAVQIHDGRGLARAALAALGVGGAFLVLQRALPRALGRGDVRLATLCAFFLGWLGLRILAVSFLAAFIAGGLVGVGLLAAGRAKAKSRLPFGPFLAFGGLLGVLAGAPLAHLWLG